MKTILGAIVLVAAITLIAAWANQQIWNHVLVGNYPYLRAASFKQVFILEALLIVGAFINGLVRGLFSD